MIDGIAQLLGSPQEWLREALAAMAAYGWWLAGAAVFATAAWTAVWVWWRRRAVAELAHRVTYNLVPAATFDPSLEEVSRRASQLGRVSAATGVLPRRAAAVRFRAACVDGKLLSQVEGPARASGVLRLSPYPQVQVVDVAEAERPQQLQVRFEDAPPAQAKGAVE